MKTKRNFLIKNSLKKKIDTKWFKVVNILMAIVIVGLINIDKVITAFGGDFDKVKQIQIVDTTNTYDKFKQYFEIMSTSAGDFANYEVIKADKDLETLKKDLKENQDNIIIVINASETEYLTTNIVSYDPLDTIGVQLITTTLNSVKSEYALANSNINPNELARISAPMTISEEVTNPEADQNHEARMIVANIVQLIFIVPFFILIVLLVQMLGADINEEKTTRGMEIIISNVSPRTHFISKILGATYFVLIQLGLIILYTVVGVLLRFAMNGGVGIAEGSAISSQITDIIDMFKISGVMTSLLQAIPIILIILILSLVAYAVFAGVLASMTTSMEDYSQLQTPLMMVIMAGYFLAFMASMFEGALFIKILSYLPFLSAMIAPTLYMLGQVGLLDLLISLLVLIGTIFILFKYGLRVYKVGILNYSSKGLWKKIFKSLKEKE